MPATLKHIETNLSRIEDPAIKEIADAAKKAHPDDLQLVWKELVEAADAKQIGHKIPGTVGRQFAAKYGMVRPRGPRVAREPVTTIRLSDAAQAALQDVRLGQAATADGADLTVMDVEATVRRINRAIEHAEKSLEKAEAARARQVLGAVVKKLS